MWDDVDGNPKDDMTVDCHDKPRWIDTSAMICDSLTKAGNANFADRLVDCMMTGLFDTTPTAESEMKKLRAKSQRKKKKIESGTYLSNQVLAEDIDETEEAVIEEQ